MILSGGCYHYISSLFNNGWFLIDVCCAAASVGSDCTRLLFKKKFIRSGRFTTGLFQINSNILDA